jgi:hypothetical protein
MRRYAALLLVLFLLDAAQALADDAEKAKEHYLKGKELVDAGAYEKAIVELEASYSLNPVPIVLYNIGLCYDELHLYASALKNYRLFVAKATEDLSSLKESVSDRIKELNKFLGILKLTVDEEGAEVLVDNKLIGKTPLPAIFIETGNHDLEIRKTGFPDIKQKIKIVSGESLELGFSMKAPASSVSGEKEPETKDKAGTEKETGEKPEPAKTRKKLGSGPFWTAVTMTGVSALTMAILGGVALKKDREVADMYEDENWKGVADERDRLKLGTNIMIGLMSAAAISALVLFFFTDFKKEKKSSAFFMVNPGSGAFVSGMGGIF